MLLFDCWTMCTQRSLKGVHPHKNYVWPLDLKPALHNVLYYCYLVTQGKIIKAIAKIKIKIISVKFDYNVIYNTEKKLSSAINKYHSCNLSCCLLLIALLDSGMETAMLNPVEIA